ncbi:hypothetical protein H5410_023113 [Solanum commersonii]|uniref:Uncharacterized protein n=1 Tax=Solanum commersonii TaxID=4109 RepID=A0A9J5ZIT5_SOLCO|nr:hypothetical protein H5410_023113 [Solanum commersonii]
MPLNPRLMFFEILTYKQDGFGVLRFALNVTNNVLSFENSLNRITFWYTFWPHRKNNVDRKSLLCLNLAHNLE